MSNYNYDTVQARNLKPGDQIAMLDDDRYTVKQLSEPITMIVLTHDMVDVYYSEGSVVRGHAYAPTNSLVIKARV